MLVLRLARTGRRNQPKYRLVVAENSKPLDGKVVEVVGHYNPTDPGKPLVINKEAISAWMGKGAKPSNTVAKLLNKEGFDLPVHTHPARPARKAPKEEPAKPAATAASDTPEAQSSEASAKDEAAAPETPVAEAPVAEEPVAEAPAAEAAPSEPEAKPEGEAAAE